MQDGSGRERSAAVAVHRYAGIRYPQPRGGQTLKTLAVVLAAGIAAGCSSLEELEYGREDFKARFLDFKHACEQVGGRIVIRTHRIGHDGLPRPGDHYRCERD